MFEQHEWIERVREMHILKVLNHPHIMKTYEAYEDKQFYYTVTELLEGGELFEAITAVKSLSETQISRIMLQLL